MAIYVFKCKNCGKTVEKIQKYNDPIPKCPECGSDMFRTVGGRIGIIYNTWGFPTMEKRKIENPSTLNI